jgi:hypothetical protein
VLAFASCEKLENAVLSDSVLTIGENAFRWCSALKEIVIPKSVTTIEESAFESCIGLQNIIVSEENKVYCSIDGTLYTKDEKTLIQYTLGKREESFAIPKGVTRVENFAFKNTLFLKSVVIPETLTEIGSYAFSGCGNLERVFMPKNVTSIDYGAFYECDNLTLYCTETKQPSGWYHIGCPVYLYSEERPMQYGYYWHYFDGMATKWW